MGRAVGQVTSVTAQLPGGRSAAGVVVSGRGFPGRVWLVNYPSADDARIVFRNASGLELGHLTVAGRPPFPRSRAAAASRCSIPGRRGGALSPAWMTAYLLDGRVGFWSSDNADSVGFQQSRRADRRPWA